MFGIPGLNGSRDFEGGMPVFDFDTFQDVGITELYMPYNRDDDQYQTVVNVNWMKGKHNVRFGTDIYFQGLNHVQPELSGGDNFGARGGFRYGGGPTQISGGPSGQHVQRMGLVPARLSRPARTPESGRPRPTRRGCSSYSFYVRDKWQMTNRLTCRFGTRYEYFPVPTRADRGLERYNPETNLMEIGGVGSVPTDLGIQVEKGLFAPRVGVTFRVTPTMVVRGGFGITNDPYSLARPMRTNHPILLNLTVRGTELLRMGGAHGGRRAADSRSGPRQRHHPDSVERDGVHAADRIQPGLHQSFNVAVQKELSWGLVGEAAYVGTRQIDQLGYRELNWSPIGGGSPAVN